MLRLSLTFSTMKRMKPTSSRAEGTPVRHGPERSPQNEKYQRSELPTRLGGPTRVSAAADWDGNKPQHEHAPAPTPGVSMARARACIHPAVPETRRTGARVVLVVDAARVRDHKAVPAFPAPSSDGPRTGQCGHSGAGSVYQEAARLTPPRPSRRRSTRPASRLGAAGRRTDGTTVSAHTAPRPAASPGAYENLGVDPARVDGQHERRRDRFVVGRRGVQHEPARPAPPRPHRRDVRGGRDA